MFFLYPASLLATWYQFDLVVIVLAKAMHDDDDVVVEVLPRDRITSRLLRVDELLVRINMAFRFATFGSSKLSVC